jgi:hypothetical protein
VIAPKNTKNNPQKPKYKLLPPPPPATKEGVPQTVIGSAKLITNYPGEKGRKTREQAITAQSCCPQQGKDKDKKKTAFL